MKRWKTTLIAVGVLVALLAYVLLVETKKEPPPRAGVTPSPTPVPLLQLAPDDLQAVQVTDGERTLRMVHEGAEWRIVEPGDGPVDVYAVYLTLDDLAHLDARIVVSDEVTDPARYGLDPVALTLVVERTDGTEERFYVGRETPDGTTFYVQRAADPRLYIVDHYKIEPFFEWLLLPPYQPTPTPVAELRNPFSESTICESTTVCSVL
jgi:hypothetical protein